MQAESEPEPVPRGDRSPLTTGGWLILLALAGVLLARAFGTVCSGFSPWDDMGYLMLSQKTLAAGQPLYDATFSQYGPAYYIWQQLLHGVVRIPLTHDSTLLLTALSRVAIALLCAGYVARMTRKLFLTVLTCAAVFHLLGVLNREPGHPQELCALLLGGMLFTSSFLPGARRSHLLLALIGFLIGLLGMTKPNLGAFAALAAWLSLAHLLEAGWSRRLLLGTGALAALALPILLMRSQLDKAAPYCLLESGAILLLLAQLVTTRTSTTLPLRNLLALAGGCAAALVVSAGYALTTGTSPGGLAYGLVLQHLGFDRAFSFWPEFGLKEVLASLAIAAACWIATRLRKGTNSERLSTLMKICLPPAFLVLMVIPGLTPGQVLCLCLPLIVVIGQPSDRQPASGGEVTARYFALALAVFNGLWGYPVWASQGKLSLFLLIPIGMVWCADGLRYGALQSESARLLSSLQARLGRMPIPYLASLALVGLAVVLAAGELGNYCRLSPSGLRGSALLRMSPEQSNVYRRLIQAINQRGRCFYTMPGLGSLYFWVNANPPTSLNPTTWMTLLTPRQQAKVVSDLQQKPELCVVRWNLLVNFWTHGRDISTNKVVRYIEDNFTAAESFEGFDILVRREPAPPAISGNQPGPQAEGRANLRR